jgi:hypothetical protein
MALVLVLSGPPVCPARLLALLRRFYVSPLLGLNFSAKKKNLQGTTTPDFRI